MKSLFPKAIIRVFSSIQSKLITISELPCPIKFIGSKIDVKKEGHLKLKASVVERI